MGLWHKHDHHCNHEFALVGKPSWCTISDHTTQVSFSLPEPHLPYRDDFGMYFPWEDPMYAFRLGPVYRGQFGEVLYFLWPTVHTILKCPHFPGTITAEWFRLCVRSQRHHILRMRTFDENSCAISITSPRSLSPPRTQHVWWDHREKSRRVSTLWDCRQTGPSLNAGYIWTKNPAKVCQEFGDSWVN